jgi:hypothetical protein
MCVGGGSVVPHFGHIFHPLSTIDAHEGQASFKGFPQYGQSAYSLTIGLLHPGQF